MSKAPTRRSRHPLPHRQRTVAYQLLEARAYARETITDIDLALQYDGATRRTIVAQAVSGIHRALAHAQAARAIGLTAAAARARADKRR